MLYFVSVNGIDADYPLDDYDNFIVEADSEQNLAAWIMAKILKSLTVPFGEEFDYNVNLEYVCKGKRL